MIVTDVQRDTSRVHRRIAEASWSDSYVAVPVMSGTQVVGLLHADCYIQAVTPMPLTAKRSPPTPGPATALSRARAAEQLNTIGSQLRTIANECHDSVASVGEFSWGSPDERSTELPLATRVTKRAVDSVREVLTAREVQILELMASGMSNARIAAQLVISEGTVKQHVKHILAQAARRGTGWKRSRCCISPTAPDAGRCCRRPTMTPMPDNLFDPSRWESVEASRI